MAVLWTEEALADLRDIFLFVFQSSPQNARLVEERILHQTDLLGDFPHIGRIAKVSGMRELIIDHAPYIVLYRPERPDVRIVAVAPARQHD